MKTTPNFQKYLDANNNELKRGVLYERPNNMGIDYVISEELLTNAGAWYCFSLLKEDYVFVNKKTSKQFKPVKDIGKLSKSFLVLSKFVMKFASQEEFTMKKLFDNARPGMPTQF